MFRNVSAYTETVKAVFLNIWHGKCRDELAAFIGREKVSTDIFCFQEADPDIREYLSTLLPGFARHTYDKPFEGRIRFTLATYVKKPLVVDMEHALLADIPDAGGALMTRIQALGTSLLVVNVHGISFPNSDNKLDTAGRIEQSKAIIVSLYGTNTPAIIGGDFNLLPESRSIRMFAQAGYRNLVLEYHIATTRNKLAWERFPGNEQYYADYVFTNPMTPVRRFAVPQVEISDHLPLIVEFDVSRAKQGEPSKSEAQLAYDTM